MKGELITAKNGFPPSTEVTVLEVKKIAKVEIPTPHGLVTRHFWFDDIKVENPHKDFEDRISVLVKTIDTVQNEFEVMGAEVRNQYRMELSTGAASLDDQYYKPLFSIMKATELAYEQAEAKCFMRHYSELKKTETKSAAESLARKHTKVDTEYILAYNEYSEALGTFKSFISFMNKIKEILNTLK